MQHLVCSRWKPIFKFRKNFIQKGIESPNWVLKSFAFSKVSFESSLLWDFIVDCSALVRILLFICEILLISPCKLSLFLFSVMEIILFWLSFLLRLFDLFIFNSVRFVSSKHLFTDWDIFFERLLKFFFSFLFCWEILLFFLLLLSVSFNF